MKSILTVAASCMLLALSACGGKLTDEQKAQVKGLNQNVSRTQEIGKKAGQKKVGLVDFGFEAKGKNPGDDNVAKIVGRISDESKAGACEIQGYQKGSNSMDMSFGIKGEKCPVVSSYSMVMSESGGMDFSFSYKVNDEQLAKYSDVTEANMKMSMVLTIAKNQKSADLTISGDGNIVSNTYGNVKIKYSGSGSVSQSSSSADMKMEIAFADFTAELGMSLDGQKVKYSINGEDVTAEEFAEYGQSLNGGAGSSFGSGSTQTKSPSTSNPGSTTDLPFPEDPSIPTEPFSAVFKALM